LNRSSRDFLYSLVDYEKTAGYNYDLDAYKNFLEHFDAPHKKLSNVILIGGTKGKGSTAAILTACLMNNGYRVGLYASPHLMKINERIKIDDTEISDSDLDRYVMMVRPSISKNKDARSFFEALTTISFLYFLEQRVDFTVLEVGLGGRLDATNATNPLISVITRIGYDHMNLLGNTLAEIAREKAGIIRENGKLITIHQRPSAGDVLKKIAASRKSTVIFADEQHHIKVLDQSLRGSRVFISGRIGEIETILPLAGLHQIENLSLTMAALFELRTMGFHLSPRKIGQGIKNTQLRGRFEVISEEPLIIFDCAHNQDSFRALNRNLDLFNIKDFYLIFGSNRDKDIRYCLRHIFPKAKEVLLVKTSNPRAIEPKDLYAMARKYQANLTIALSVEEAVRSLKTRVERCSAIVVTGSFYIWQQEWKVSGS